MKDGWQMIGRWKKHGTETELFKKGHESSFLDRMISSASSLLLGIKVK